MVSPKKDRFNQKSSNVVDLSFLGFQKEHTHIVPFPLCKKLPHFFGGLEARARRKVTIFTREFLPFHKDEIVLRPTMGCRVQRYIVHQSVHQSAIICITHQSFAITG